MMRKTPIRLPKAAVRAPLPARLDPQLAVLGDMPTDAEGYIFEIKYDGYRMLARVDQAVQLFTRNGHDWTARMPRLREAIAALALPPGWYDGEAVICDESGRPDFGRIQASFSTNECDEIVLYLFDAPYMYGHDLRAVPLADRRALLARALEASPQGLVRFSKALAGAPTDILEAACEMGLEGIMCKRSDAPYVNGRRSTTWVKAKCGRRETLVIGGYVTSRRGILQKLLLGEPKSDGRLHYAGNVGTGFSEKMRRDLGEGLAMITTDESSFALGQVCRNNNV